MFVALTGRDPKSYQMKNLAAQKKLMFEEGSSIKFTDKNFWGQNGSSASVGIHQNVLRTS
jgi:hypothetical protein